MAEWRGPRAGRCSSSPRLNLHGWNAGKLRKPRDPEDPTIKRDPSLLSNYLILIFLAFLACPPPPSPPLSFSSILHLSSFFGRKEGFFDPKKEKIRWSWISSQPFFPFDWIFIDEARISSYLYLLFFWRINYNIVLIIVQKLLFSKNTIYIDGLFAKLHKKWIIEFSVL